MHWLVGVGLSLLLALSVFFVVTGAAARLRKRRRSGAMVLVGIALYLTYAIVIAVLARPGHVDGTIDPSQKARVLAENISELMNSSFWGFPLGLLVGAVRAIRDRRATI